MRHIVIIDTENLMPEENQIDLLDSDVELIFFISKNSKKMALNALKQLYEKNIKLSFEHVSYKICTKNCLDFHIVAFISFQPPDENITYYILSNDNGYKDVSKYIEARTGKVVKVINHLSGIETKKQAYDKEQCYIKEILTNCLTNSSTMQQVYRQLVKHLRENYSMLEISLIYKEHKEELKQRLEAAKQLFSTEELVEVPIAACKDTSTKPILTKNARINKVKALKKRANTLAEFKLLLQTELSKYTLDMDIPTIYKNNIHSFSLLKKQ